MASLQRAVSIADTGEPALMVNGYLGLHMPRARHEPLSEDIRHSERRACLRLGSRHGILDLSCLADEPYAPPSATGDCLDQHG